MQGWKMQNQASMESQPTQGRIFHTHI